MVIKPRRFRQTEDLVTRLINEGQRLRQQVKTLPPGSVREVLARGSACPAYNSQSRTVVTIGYYAYVIDHDGHVMHRIDILCDTDEEALRHAAALVDGHTIELWQESRRRGIFPAKEAES